MQTSRLNTATPARLHAFAHSLLRVLIALLSMTILANGIAYAQGPSDITVTRQSIQKFGNSKRVKLREVDGSAVKGTISAINDDSFLLIPKGGGAPRSISYSQVGKVQRDGMSTGAKVAIWATAALVVYAIIGLIVIHERGLI